MERLIVYCLLWNINKSKTSAAVKGCNSSYPGRDFRFISPSRYKQFCLPLTSELYLSASILPLVSTSVYFTEIDACWGVFTAVSHSGGKFDIQIGSDWPEMGQIWDFLRSVSVHFGVIWDLLRSVSVHFGSSSPYFPIFGQSNPI